MAISLGDQLGAYRILSRLGAGAMGEVYRASDTRLGRDVALKLLPDDMAADPDRLARFQREARAAAALNHPNIVTVYSVEQAEGVHFQTMELVDGRPLQEMIPPDGMAAGRVVELACAMADAIAAAHDKDVVHRDLKPANIMITADGRVKLLDFGLAKVVRAVEPNEATRADVNQTQFGVVLGTPSYMSPEQISGAAVDHRTDIFALGTTLYEMLTGRRPFQGATQMQLAASILRDPMPVIVKPGVPGALVDLIARCLAKDVHQRVSSARVLAGELQSIRAGSAQTSSVKAPDGFWVAVDVFKSTGASAALVALAEGLTEEIIAGLSRFSYLRVLTKGTAGARYVLEGSLRQAGSQVRLAVKLIDTTTGANLWAENFTRAYSPDSIFEIQDDLVPVIVAPIAETHGVLEHHMWIALRDRDPLTFTPYEALLRSRGFAELNTFEEYNLAIAGLTRAVEQEPNHAGCLAMLSMIHSLGWLLGWESEASLNVCLSYARRAVAAEPSYQLAHAALLYAHGCRREIAAVRTAGERVLALNPFNGAAIVMVGVWTAYLGDWERGCELVERARTLNTRHLGWYWYPLAHNAYRQRDYPRALDYALRINNPGQYWVHILMAAAHAQMGNHGQAAEAVRELLALKPDFESDPRREMRWFPDGEHVDHLLEGLRRAGMKIGDV